MDRTKFVRQSPGHYRRADGVTIDRSGSGEYQTWNIYLPTGQPACAHDVMTGEPMPWSRAWGPTLAAAKSRAERITPDTPPYVVMERRR